MCDLNFKIHKLITVKLDWFPDIWSQLTHFVIELAWFQHKYNEIQWGKQGG